MQMMSIRCGNYADEYPIGTAEFGRVLSNRCLLGMVRCLIIKGPMNLSELQHELAINHLEDAIGVLSRDGIVHTRDHVLDDTGAIVSFKYDVYPIWKRALEQLTTLLSRKPTNFSRGRN